jgi:hypothetical protein
MKELKKKYKMKSLVLNMRPALTVDMSDKSGTMIFPSSVDWPSRSPVLNHLDFTFLGTSEDTQLCDVKILDQRHLKHKAAGCTAVFRPHMLNKFRLYISSGIFVRSRHFGHPEHYEVFDIST